MSYTVPQYLQNRLHVVPTPRCFVPAGEGPPGPDPPNGRPADLGHAGRTLDKAGAGLRPDLGRHRPTSPSGWWKVDYPHTLP